MSLVYSGGASFAVTTKWSEAEAARRLWQNLGVPKTRITMENESLDTKMNALGLAGFVQGKRVILVTSTFQVPRSMLLFLKAGVDAVPAPTEYRAKRSP